MYGNQKELMFNFREKLKDKGLSKEGIQTVIKSVNNYGGLLNYDPNDGWSSIPFNRRITLLNYHAESIVNPSMRGFSFVRQPLMAYKQASQAHLVNLIIPVGSLIYCSPYQGSSLKLRTNLCLTHSIWDGLNNEFIYYKSTASRGNGLPHDYKTNFFNEPSFNENYGNKVEDRVHINIPALSFSLYPNTCTSGIHFFLDPVQALTY